MLRDHHAVNVQQVMAGNMGDGRLQQFRLIGRVQKDQVIFFPGGLEKFHGVPGHYPAPVRQIAELQVFAGQSCRIRPPVHKHSGSRAPAEALDAQLAGAGKQVQDLTALNIKLQDVEQPFLHPVGGGPCLHPL